MIRNLRAFARDLTHAVWCLTSSKPCPLMAIRHEEPLPFNVVDLVPAADEPIPPADWETFINERPRTYDELRARAETFEALMDDWRREVYLCADRELAEMLEGEA